MNNQTNSPTSKRIAHSLTDSANPSFDYQDSSHITINKDRVNDFFSTNSAENSEDFQEISPIEKKESYEKVFGKGIL